MPTGASGRPGQDFGCEQWGRGSADRVARADGRRGRLTEAEPAPSRDGDRRARPAEEPCQGIAGPGLNFQAVRCRLGNDGINPNHLDGLPKLVGE